MGPVLEAATGVRLPDVADRHTGAPRDEGELGFIPANESERLAAVKRYDILDTPLDGAFDRSTTIAARLFNVPISIVSIVDRDRIWFKSHHGVSATKIGRDPGLCASAILLDEPRILPDAKRDLHALANPLVAGEFGLRFYAGVPLRTSDGFNLGTLCVIDKEPREVSAEEIAHLNDLASIVMDQLELRLEARKNEEATHQRAEVAQRFLFMAETMPQKMFTARANGDVDYFNSQWTKFTGLTFDQIRDWGWTQFIHPDDVEENIRRWRHSIETGEPFESVHRFQRADGAYRWHLSRAHAMRDAAGNISMWIGSNTEIHEQKEMAETLRQREEALRESEARLREREALFRTLADNMSQLAWMADEKGWIFWYNRRWYSYTGTTLEQMQGWGWKQVHHQDHVDRVVRRIQHSWDTGEVWEDTFPLRGEDGRYRRFLSRAEPIRDADGTILRWFGTNTDITERRQAEEQQGQLLREMNHRVKNLFALAGSVVTLSARTAGTPKDLAEAVRERLAALARAHELTLPDLAEGGDKPDWATSLPTLVRTIVSPYVAKEDARVTINGPDVPVCRNAVTSMALLLHEIATNAAKYGALSTESGHVVVSWSAANGELLLAWREQGGPPLNGQPENEGFGSLLAKLTVTGQLAGKISRDWNRKGLTVNLSASLERLTM